MRAVQKLIRNGNATGVTIPRQILVSLGWLPGEQMIIEVLEDHSLRVRRPVERDFAPIAAPRLVTDDAAAVLR